MNNLPSFFARAFLLIMESLMLVNYAVWPKRQRYVAENSKVYIFTEIYGCGKIGKVALDSFCRHHPRVTVHIYGTDKDFLWIKKRPNIVFVNLGKSKHLLNGFRAGHLGTARLWAELIMNRPERYLVHFDSDTLFRAPVIHDLTSRFAKDYDLVGSIRNYKHNPNHRKDVRHLPDLCQTAIFGFNRERIDRFPKIILERMCQGIYNPTREPVIDFFDPIMFNILKNGGKIHHLSQADFGGCDYYGKREVGPYPALNRLIDFGRKFIHFSAVGSGMNFFENRQMIYDVPDSYVNYAIEKYAMYCKIFYNEEINFHYDQKQLKALSRALAKDIYGKE